MQNKMIKNAVYVLLSSKSDPPFISYGMRNTLSRFFLSLERPVKTYVSQSYCNYKTAAVRTSNVEEKLAQL